jgi:hypothetical protein
MRAIDGDVLFREMEKAQWYNNADRDEIAEELVLNAPTIEPQRKKGRWIKKTIKKKIENDYSCSVCGRHVSVMRGYDVRLVYPFCHCGAEMLTEDKG